MSEQDESGQVNTELENQTGAGQTAAATGDESPPPHTDAGETQESPASGEEGQSPADQQGQQAQQVTQQQTQQEVVADPLEADLQRMEELEQALDGLPTDPLDVTAEQQAQQREYQKLAGKVAREGFRRSNALARQVSPAIEQSQAQQVEQAWNAFAKTNPGVDAQAARTVFEDEVKALLNDGATRDVARKSGDRKLAQFVAGHKTGTTGEAGKVKPKAGSTNLTGGGVSKHAEPAMPAPHSVEWLERLGTQ